MIELQIEDSRGNIIRHQLGEGRHTLGKSLDSDVVLMDSFASRYHADIVVSGKGIFIIDADSKNGIRMNDKRIKKTLKVETGQVFTIGKLSLSIKEPKFKLFIKPGRKPEKQQQDELKNGPDTDIQLENIDDVVSKILMT